MSEKRDKGNKGPNVGAKPHKRKGRAAREARQARAEARRQTNE